MDILLRRFRLANARLPRVLSLLAAWDANYRMRLDLSEMPQQRLDDIGLTRAEADKVAASWAAPTWMRRPYQ